MNQYIREKECPAETVVEGHISRRVKSYDKNLMLVEVDFSDGAVGEVHRHPQEQISYCVSGSFDYSVEEKVYRLEKGDTIYVPSGLAHGCRLLSPSGTLLDIFTPYREDFVKEKQ